MIRVECPECGHQNSPQRATCRKCGIGLQETKDKYIDCYVCDGTGEIILDYAAEYAHEIQNEDRALPCAKCAGTGKLSFNLVRKETGKTLFRSLLVGISRIRHTP